MLRFLSLPAAGLLLLGTLAPSRGQTGTGAEVYADLDPKAPDAAWTAADRKGEAEGRVTGTVPPGWEDNSAWAKAQAAYSPAAEDGQRYLAVKVDAVGTGSVQFHRPLRDYPDGSLFRLVVKARGAPRAQVEFGIRQVERPFAFAWSQTVPLESGWKTYEYLFTLKRNPAPMGFWFAVKSPGQVDIASLRLEGVSRDRLVADLQARYPDGGPANVLRTTRLPLGLQSGWTLGRDAAATLDAEPTAEADPGVMGPSGGPAFHLRADGPLRLWSEPFAVPLPFQKYTASVYVKGTGSGALVVCREREAVARAEFQAGDGWTRVEVPFDPELGVKFYALRLETQGEVWADGWQVGPGGKAGPYASQLPAEVSLACAAKETGAARIQFADEPARVAYAVSTAAPRAGLTLKGKVVDLYGGSADLPPIPLEARALARGAFDFPAPPLHPLGAFRIEAWVEDADGKRVSAYQEIVVHRLQRPRHWGEDAPDSPFGIHVEADTTHLLMAKAAGVNWARLHDTGARWIGWWFLEPEPGKWTFGDAAIGRYRRQHLKILGCLATAPPWASCLETPGMAGGSIFDEFFQPRDPRQYADYVRTVAERYKGAIDAYDIWNEPWIAAFFARRYDPAKAASSKGGKYDRAGYLPSENPPADYARLLRAANGALKGVDPAITVVGLNSTTTEKVVSSYPDLSGAAWSRAAKAQGIERDCDVLGYHQYDSSFQGFPGDAAEKGHDVAVGPFLADGVKKPVWLTEGSSVVGYASSGFYHYTLPYEDAEDVLDTGNRLCRQVVSLLSLHVAKVFLYSMGTYQYFGSARDNPWLSLVAEDGSLHPDADAFSAMAWRLEDARFEKTIGLGGGSHATLFSRPDGAVAVVAPAQGGLGKVVPDLPGWIAADLLGNPLPERKVASNHLFYLETKGSASDLEKKLADSLGAPFP